MQTARDLFIARGYARVTMSEIARTAGTAVKTVYASVGTKVDLLHALIDSDMAGFQTTAALEQLGDASSLESAIALVARGARADYERAQSVIDLLYSAAASDDGAREAWQDVITRYRRALREAAEEIVRKGLVAPRFEVQGVADRLWFCFGLAAWRALVVDCKWTYDDAEKALRRQARCMLTED
ncbi:helix-turn-helix transcriptional regulator [Streptomyces oryzae]|uniref:Helix-turn-helix transcriptional regulator n=1 Tax=Streptomyces oryzae TaxID=1434886 RepID=A0ABS3X4Q1_9ACTN|nr:TetR/AcrR family transcriptional regulator [Streptomyces oryzae]MBO8190323.1 helix-turn-helix transcriptional regulator [Streptomyces oryzae]